MTSDQPTPAVGEACPDLGALARYAEDACTAEERERIAVHTEQCPRCRERLEEIREAEEFLRRIRPREGEEGSFAFEPPAGTAARPSPPEIAERPGSIVGRYTLLEQIGEGGFGVVFSAEQREPVARRVALKILKPGMDSRQVLARFEAERHTLAKMDHPNIARVLDAGATEAGRPYFVMELVEGEPITRFCDGQRLTLRERLDLFRTVCAAVQHAHQKGVIHRDLKPSNVLVALKDAAAVPKVIDFGIAKATDQHLAEQTVFTRLGQFIGTPEYMSPEQASGPGVDIDTRSDVYSLGVLLYELLTGATPHDPESLRRAGLAEIQRIIREGETPRPSTRLSTIGGLEAVAASRRIDPRRLALQLRGDLDWILLKTLEKDRARRYDTVAALGEDLRRYLESEPVLAGPPSAAYRLRKFARRNRGGVVGGATVAVVLVAGLAGTSVGMVHARRAEGQRTAEADWANTVASLQATPFLSPQMREIYLSRWEARLDAMRNTLPPDDVDLIRQEGLVATWGWDAYVGAEAEAFLKQEVESQLDDRVDFLDTGVSRARLPRSSIIWPDPIPLLSTELDPVAHLWGERATLALQRSQRHLDESDPLWIALVNIRIQWQLINISTAREIAASYEMLVRACDAAHGESSTPSLGGLCNWAAELGEAGCHAEGLVVLKEYARRRAAAAVVPSSELYVPQRRVIATFADHDDSELFGEFLRIHFADVAIWQRWGSNRYRLAGWTYASWLAGQDRFTEAEKLFADLLRSVMREPIYAAYAAGPLYRLGECRMRLGRLGDAEDALREALACIDKSGRREYEYQVKGALGRCLREQGRYDEAEPLLLAAYQGCPGRPRDPEEVRDSGKQIVDLYTRWKRPQDAEAWRRSVAEEVVVPKAPTNLRFEQRADTGIPGWRCRSAGYAFPDLGERESSTSYASLSDILPAEGELCARLRGAPDGGTFKTGPYTALSQSFSAAAFRGKRIRVSAYLRVDAPSDEDRAAIHLYVPAREIDGYHRADQSGGWPIRASEWKRYGITCRVGNDASVISLAVLAVGGATVWIDDVQIEVIEPDGSATHEGAVTDVAG